VCVNIYARVCLYAWVARESEARRGLDRCGLVQLRWAVGQVLSPHAGGVLKRNTGHDTQVSFTCISLQLLHA
jgi:hypothetical protein